ncbi:unnamed protein product, partial [Pylaiella littoralis]
MLTCSFFIFLPFVVACRSASRLVVVIKQSHHGAQAVEYLAPHTLNMAPLYTFREISLSFSRGHTEEGHTRDFIFCFVFIEKQSTSAAECNFGFELPRIHTDL